MTHKCSECQGPLIIVQSLPPLLTKYWWCKNPNCIKRHNGWITYNCSQCFKKMYPDVEILKIVGKVITIKDQSAGEELLQEMQQGKYICQDCV